MTQLVVGREPRREEGQQRIKFHPVQLTRDVMAVNPGASKKSLMIRAKGKLAEEDAISRREHTESLPRQGQLMQATPEHDPAAEIWASAVSNLPSESLKFAMNAATDTLPHNANLALWRHADGISGNCKLCGNTQTLVHVLNSCQVALNLRRYNSRHDAILTKIATFAKFHLPNTFKILSDLPGTSYLYPPHIGTTDLRPDLLIWSDEAKEINLIELTICFETAFDEAIRRKTNRYSEVREEAIRHGYQANILPIEVGSRGTVHTHGFDNFATKLDQVGKREWKTFLVNLAQTAIVESHKIWCQRNWRNKLSIHVL